MVSVSLLGTNVLKKSIFRKYCDRNRAVLNIYFAIIGIII